MTNEQIIREAISDSVRANEIVHCEITSVSGEIHDLVTSTYAGEWDSNSLGLDDDGCEMVDVYSLESDSPSALDWRICVRSVKDANDA